MKGELLFLVIILAIGQVACNKEEPLTPSANFTTNIQNNTLMAGQGFVVYLDDVQGEFLTYFRGNTFETTYDPNDPRKRGTAFSSDLDSLVLPGYSTPDTTFVFTLVASSSGNWAKDYVQDVKSISIAITAP